MRSYGIMLKSMWLKSVRDLIKVLFVGAAIWFVVYPAIWFVFGPALGFLHGGYWDGFMLTFRWIMGILLTLEIIGNLWHMAVISWRGLVWRVPAMDLYEGLYERKLKRPEGVKWNAGMFRRHLSAARTETGERREDDVPPQRIYDASGKLVG